MSRATRRYAATGRSLAGAACLFLAISAVRAAEPRPVQDLYYGEALYQFYQQKYFTALAHLSAAQQLERVPHHRDEAELLRGGLFLSYGLHVEAGAIFARLIEAGAPPAVADRAWFYLAKIRYQRGYTPEAEDALARIRGTLPDELQEEREVLGAMLAMGRGDYARAIEMLERLRGASPWAAYGRYNLGVALVKSGRKEEGIALLDKVGRRGTDDEELAALRDKANVALGYVFLHDQRPDRAKTSLERVRLRGALSNKALLGVGWAESALGANERALVPWLELQKSDVIDGAVQESLLAVPYAFGKLGAYRQSLQHYEDAIAAYSREIDRLSIAMEAIHMGKMVDNLLRPDPDDEAGWFWRLEAPPDSPEVRYLLYLLARHDFQEALKNYRDLRWLLRNLEDAHDNLTAFGDMLATRRAAYAARLPWALHSLRVLDARAPEAAREAFARELAHIEHEGDAIALGNSDQRAQWARLESVGRRLARLPGTDVAELRDKYRLVRGIALWNLHAQYPERLWQAQKALRELDRALAETRARRAAVDRVQIDAPKGFEGYDARIAGLHQRVADLHTRVTAATEEQEHYLEQLALQELAQQRERLAIYLSQARFAVAQIYDQAAASAKFAPDEAATPDAGAARNQAAGQQSGVEKPPTQQAAPDADAGPAAKRDAAGEAP